MKDPTRTLLIDPDPRSRGAIRRALVESGRASVVAEAMTYDRPAAASEMVVVNLDTDIEAAIRLVQGIAATEPRPAVLAASASRDGGLLLRAIRAGAREFLMLPADPADLAWVLDRLGTPAETPPPPEARRGPGLVAVTGASGGVGCTTIAINLAVGLAKNFETSVLLADLDLLFGVADVALDLLPEFTLLDAIRGIDRVDEAMLRRAVAKHASGIQILPRPVEIEDADKIDPDALRRLLAIAKTTFSTVVVDTSKSLQTSDFVAYELADVVLVVVQPDVLGVRNAARLLKLLRQDEVLAEKIKLVANRVGSHEAEVGLKKAEETLGAPFAWRIPNATKILQAARSKGVPVASEGAGTKAHQALLDMAHALRPFPGLNPEAKRRRGFFAALF